MTPPRPPSRGRRREQGFTLVEMLIALSLTTVIFALLFSGMRFGSRVWEGGEERQEATAAFQATYRVLRSLAAASVPATWGEKDDLSYVFTGAPDGFRLVADGAIRADVGGPILYALSVEGMADGVALVLRRAPYDHLEEAPGDLAEAVPVTLLGPVRDIRFSYFGREDREEEESGSWFDSWDIENNLPLLLRLQVVGPDGEAWPQAVFPMPVNLDLGCLFADRIATSKCRLVEDEAG